MTDLLSSRGPQPCAAAVVVAASYDAGRQRLRWIAEEHFDAVWCFFRRLGIPPKDIEDATQDVMMVAANRLGSIAPGSERAFLFGTAYRIALRWGRPTAHEYLGAEEAIVDAPDPGPTLDALLDDARARACLDEVLEALPIELRTVFVLAEIDELTAPQIAQLLELPVGTVASRLRRARKQFDERLARLRASWGRGGAS
jgi:RNA polymerase sigma-70 factor, ECF subfamily